MSAEDYDLIPIEDYQPELGDEACQRIGAILNTIDADRRAVSLRASREVTR